MSVMVSDVVAVETRAAGAHEGILPRLKSRRAGGSDPAWCVSWVCFDLKADEGAETLMTPSGLGITACHRADRPVVGLCKELTISRAASCISTR
jgi:hypothetical protein